MTKYVLLVEDDKKGQKDYYRTIDEIISITDKDGQPVEGLQITAKDFKVGDRDYGISILTRMNELDKLLDSYGDDQTSAAYQGYKAEYDTLYQRLEDAGCIKDGKFKSIVVNYVEIPDLVARGGNVNVTTDNFYSSNGQGKVTAKGTPSINIVNDTNLAMNINNISVADAGGQIFYNDKALNPGTDTSVEKINEALAKEISQANKDHGKTISKAYAATGSAGTINIKGNNQLSKYYIYYEYVDVDGNTQTVEDNQAVKADIFINGTVSAPDGTIKIESAKNDIIIEGKSAGDNNALVTAKTVNLIAGNGSVNQGYVDNIVNIGGDPRNLYDEVDKKTLKPNQVNKISSTVSVGQG
ncbi:MAG: hypothetical protein HUJ56_08670, partial [Erysipelotrichaceae bacterium]|nr:hypothetical protein [Erysipelotrichaceae bacterium]